MGFKIIVLNGKFKYKVIEKRPKENREIVWYTNSLKKFKDQHINKEDKMSMTGFKRAERSKEEIDKIRADQEKRDKKVKEDNEKIWAKHIEEKEARRAELEKQKKALKEKKAPAKKAEPKTESKESTKKAEK